MGQEFLDYLERVAINRPAIAAGPTGTTLMLPEFGGFKAAKPLFTSAANLTHVQAIQKVQEAWGEVADSLATPTFRTSHDTFRRAGIADYVSEADQALHQGCAATKAAAHKSGKPYVGVFGPFGDSHSYQPERLENVEAVRASHHHQTHALKRQGVKALLAEAASSLIDAREMALAAHNAGLPFVIGHTLDGDASNPKLFDGTTIEEAERVTRFPWRIGIAFHCSGAEVIQAAIRETLKINAFDGFIAAYPNGPGKPATDGINWEHDFSLGNQEKSVSEVRDITEISPRIKLVALCCGGKPEDLKAVKSSFEQHPQRRYVAVGTVAQSSALSFAF